jgi:FAD:protein FMN transferase
MFAKGHAVDLAVAALAETDCPFGIANAGGDLRAFGDYGQPVSIRDEDGVTYAPVTVRNMAVATSANRHMRKLSSSGETSPHIGRCGVPILADDPVTVIAPSCIIADAMTKVALADPPLASRLLKAHGGFILQRTLDMAA